MQNYRTPIPFGRLIMFIGQNPDFKVYWNPQKQHYSVWKLDKHIINVFKFTKAKNYLN